MERAKRAKRANGTPSCDYPPNGLGRLPASLSDPHRIIWSRARARGVAGRRRAQDFATSTNANHRKGGLIGLAATAIGLMHDIRLYLDALLPPVLHCLDDPESRVRCVSLRAERARAVVASGAARAAAAHVASRRPSPCSSSVSLLTRIADRVRCHVAGSQVLLVREPVQHCQGGARAHPALLQPDLRRPLQALRRRRH